ncbi:MAG TPA: hypothetical protein VHB20_13905 [Verrucomicrobiae bacterium]|jgi:hypothetical protein|nr:hypothetical protein [Verrucomicrobiae bacterium]
MPHRLPMKFLCSLALALAFAGARADTVTFSETYNDVLVKDPLYGYYALPTATTTARASLAWKGGIDITSFDYDTAVSVDLDGIGFSQYSLGDDPSYQPGKKSAVFTETDFDTGLSDRLALSWTATTLSITATFYYDIADLEDAVFGGVGPFSIPPLHLEFTMGTFTSQAVTLTLPVRDTIQKVRIPSSDPLILNHASVSGAAHDPLNPFFDAQGVYNGLFVNDTVAPDNSGAATFTLTTSGAYSGKLLLQGVAWPFTGQFTVNADHTISSATTVKRKKLGDWQLSLNLLTNLQPTALTGSVAAAEWESGLSANRTVYDSAAAPAGVFNSALAPAGPDSAAAPGGYGYGRTTVSSKGAVTLAWNLADGVAGPVTFAGSVAQDGSFPYYFSLYKGQGVLLGWGQFGAASTPAWVKNPTSSKFYPAGFTADFQGDFALAAARYTAPKARANLFGQTSVTLSLQGADIPAVTNFPFTYNPVKNTFVAAAANTNAISLALNLQTGVFSGSFNPGGGKVLFHGAFLPDADAGYGFFDRVNQTGSVTLLIPK